MKKPIPFGKYELLERVSVGGMAEVFKAKAFGVEGFERLVAVKRILPSIAKDREFITMFIDEAKIAVQLHHPNVAQIFDLGKVGESYFIAMEYVDGKDLRTVFDHLRKRGRTVPVSMACHVVMKVGEGLDYAHDKRSASGRPLRLVHRDVSPQNILISYEGETKIIDFGIAKAAGKAGKTQAGILKGKFAYMSPEQIGGHAVDRRSDVFALGVVLHEILTGERLFVGPSDFATLENVRGAPIAAPSQRNPDVPVELDQIVLRALARDPDARYPTALALHDDLQSFMYAAGLYFSRADLAAMMARTFAAERRRAEPASGPPTPPIPTPFSDAERADERRTREDLPPVRAAATPDLGLPRAEAPRAASAPTPSRLGVGSVPPPVPAAALQERTSTPAPPSSVPPVLAGDLDGAELAMEWDDDEMATMIYDRPEDEVLNAFPDVDEPDLPVADLRARAVRSEPTLRSSAPPSRRSSRPPGPGAPSPFGPQPSGGEAQRGTGRRLVVAAAVALGLLAFAGAFATYRLLWAPGTVHVTAHPASATVLLDGRPLERRADGRHVLREVPPGSHQLEIREPGYVPWRRELRLPPGGTVILDEVTLQPAAAAPAPGEGGPTAVPAPDRDREAGSIPPGGEGDTKADGEGEGAEPRSDDGASPGAGDPLEERPERGRARGRRSTPGYLAVRPVPWSNVFVDGRLVGHTPQPGIRLPAGRHRITLVNDEQDIRREVSVRIVPGETERLDLTLRPDG
ncbi:MAG: serine/threonine-protein kinase [Sandaracinaceae bacterium]